MPQAEKDKIKKYDELLLQNQALKKRMKSCKKVGKVAESMIQDFEKEIDNLKKDILRAEQANEILHKKIEEKDKEIEKLEKK